MATISALILLAGLAATYASAQRFALVCFDQIHMRQFSLHSGRRLLERLKKRLLSIKPFARIAKSVRMHRRTEEFERGMPEVLRLLCIALESGSSLVLALRYAADNCEEPLASELKRTVWDLEAGQGFDEALDKLRSRTGGTEFAYLAVAMEIQHQSGGSLTDILTSVSTMLQQSASLKDDLRTKTTQGRLSCKVVAIMPFALLILLSFFSPDYLSSFMGSPIGVLMFVLALLLEAVGVVLVRRAVAIDFTVDLEEGV